MTKEEATKKLADIIFNAAKNGYMPYDTNDEMCAMNIAKKHIDEFYTSIPSNMDEAAEKEIERFCSDILNVDIIWARMPLTKRFGLQMAKFGAEWMAGQGVNADFEVCKLANSAWLTPIDEKRFMQDIFGNFEADDKVVVQIRKK